MKVRLTNIQRFCLNDGPGIRTTIFFKGCSLNCPWCANPENIHYDKEKYFNFDSNTQEIFGYDIEIDELEKEILKDKLYYSINNGGVTFSGGEPLIFLPKIEPLLERLKSNGINICVETSLFVPKEDLSFAIKYIDEFIVDIKILEKKMCKEILNGDLDLYYSNIGLLFNNVEKEKILLRIPLTKEYTFDKKNIENLIKFLIKYKPIKIEVFKLHYLGEKKYKVLNKEMKKFEKLSDADVSALINKIKKIGIDIIECKI